MSIFGRHLLDFEGLTAQKIGTFFSKIQSFDFSKNLAPNTHIVAHLFFEPSTRTQLSFNVATVRCGAHPLNFLTEFSSLKKGETFLDTVLTIQAMGVSCFIIRHGFEETLRDHIVPFIKTPIINAGEGTTGHPTQALLDCYTIFQKKKKVEGEKILFIGDIEHSRVAKSNFELIQLLGGQVGICGPEDWLPLTGGFEFEYFDKLEAALKWADVCIALRIQKERHDKNYDINVKNYQLNKETLKYLKRDTLIFHPGPFNRGIEITNEVLTDHRCCIWDQVENGVKIRMLILRDFLRLE